MVQKHFQKENIGLRNLDYSKGKKNRKNSWFKSIFKKKKEKEYKIKNKWLRVSLKVFLISLLVMSVSLVLGLAGWSNPHTVLGSDWLVTFFFTLMGVSLYVGTAAFLSLIISGIALLLKK